MFISNNWTWFHFQGKENLRKRQRVSKYYENDCLQNFILHFVSLLTAKLVKNSNILARIYFIFRKNVLNQSWNSSSTTF